MFKRVMSLVLAVLAVFSLCAPAFAGEEATTPEESPAPEVTSVPEAAPIPEDAPIPEETPILEETPIQEAALTQEAAPVPEETEGPEATPAVTAGVRGGIMTIADVSEDSQQEAAAWVRARLKAREETIAVNFYFTDAPHDAGWLSETLNGYISRIWSLALAHTGQPEEGDYISGQVRQSSAQKQHTVSPASPDGNDWIYECAVTYTVSYHTTAEQEQQTAVQAAAVLGDITGVSSYDKIKGVYDYLCQNVQAAADGTAYGALCQKGANSQGVALAVYRLALAAGVPCRVVNDEGNTKCWNIVQLSGAWYQLDAAAGAGQSPAPQYFLAGSGLADHTPAAEYSAYTISSAAYESGGEETPSAPSATAAPVPQGQIAGSPLAWRIEDDVLTISGSGSMPDFAASVSAPWQSRRYQFSRVQIEKGVTSIGGNAFCNHPALTDVAIPDTVSAIGMYAFSGCSALAEAAIPAGVKTIKENTFRGCAGLKTVTLPEGLTEIEANAFYGCSGLGGVTFPESLETIGFNAFQLCTGLTEVVIPAGVTSIGRAAFINCTGLRSITVKNPDCLIDPGAYGTLGESNAVTVHGYDGSTAETYAKAFGYPFASLGAAPVPTPTSTPEPSSTPVPASTPEPTLIPAPTAAPQTTKAPQPTAAPEATPRPTEPGATPDTPTATPEPTPVPTAAPTSKPAQPKVSKVTNTAEGVTITWKAVEGAEHYTVYSKTGTGKWKKVGDTAETSYTWTKAKSGTKYSFSVSATNIIGSSKYNKTGKSITYMATPKVKSAKIDASGVKITWAKVKGAAKYQVMYKTGDGAWKVLAKSATGTSYTWAKAKSATKYSFSVSATNDLGSSKYNKTGKSITYVAAPKVKSAKIDASGVKITWKAVKGAEKYQVMYKTGDGKWKVLAKSATGTSYTWKKAKSGTKYSFSVRAVASDGTKGVYNTAGKSIAYRK